MEDAAAGQVAKAVRELEPRDLGPVRAAVQVCRRATAAGDVNSPSGVKATVFVTVALATQEKSPGYLLHGIVDYVPPEEDIVNGEDLRGYTPPAASTPTVQPGLTPA